MNTPHIFQPLDPVCAFSLCYQAVCQNSHLDVSSILGLDCYL